MEYKKHFEKLPPVVKELLEKENISQKLHEIAKNYKIHLDKWIPLEDEVMLTLVGAKPAELLSQNISRATGIDMVEAQVLTEELGQKIFKPINEKLQDLVQGGKRRAIETLKSSISDETPDVDYKESNSNKRPFSSDDPYREPIE